MTKQEALEKIELLEQIETEALSLNDKRYALTISLIAGDHIKTLKELIQYKEMTEKAGTSFV